MDGEGTMEWGVTTVQTLLKVSSRQAATGGTATSGSEQTKKQLGSDSKKSTKDDDTFDDSINGNGEKGLYRGSWKSNKMQGYGIFKWASGRTYEGDWNDDQKSGVGVLTFKGGNEY